MSCCDFRKKVLKGRKEGVCLLMMFLFIHYLMFLDSIIANDFGIDAEYNAR